MCEALSGIGVKIRAGVHAGEIEVHDDGDISVVDQRKGLHLL